MPNPNMPNDAEIKEVWKDVVGYEGYYSVSNFGRIRRDKPYRSTKNNRILIQNKNPKYLVVSLSVGNAKRTMRVHKMVSEAFLGKCPSGYQVNHKDTNKFNNHISNLEYLTAQQNTLHAHRNGCFPSQKGELNYFAQYRKRINAAIHTRLERNP